MPQIRRVMEYANLSYHDALNLPCDTFLLMAKNHFIREMNSSKEGREYLEKCERLKATDIDINALRKFKK